MKAGFTGRVAEVRPNHGMLAANGDVVSATVRVEAGGVATAARQVCEVIAAWPHAKAWAGRKVHVTVEEVE